MRQNPRSFVIKHNLKKSFTMTTKFVDLQGFIVGKKFVVKEVAVEKRSILSDYIFTCHYVEFIDKIRKVLLPRVLITMDCNGKTV